MGGLLRVYGLDESHPSGLDRVQDIGSTAEVEHRFGPEAMVAWDRDMADSPDASFVQVGRLLCAFDAGADSLSVYVNDGWVSVPMQFIMSVSGYLKVGGPLGFMYIPVGARQIPMIEIGGWHVDIAPESIPGGVAFSPGAMPGDRMMVKIPREAIGTASLSAALAEIGVL